MMMRAMAILGVLACVPGCTGDDEAADAPASSNESAVSCWEGWAPPPVRTGRKFEVDLAAILAMRMHEVNEVVLDMAQREEIEQLLYRAYQLDPQLAYIEAQREFSMNELLVTAELPEVRAAWDQGRLETGVAALDALLAEHGAVEVTSFDNAAAYVITFDNYLYMPLLAAMLEDTEGIDTADVAGYFYLGAVCDDIELIRHEGDWLLSFTMGWGIESIPSSCHLAHWWTVRLSDDGTARFDGEGGDPLSCPAL